MNINLKKISLFAANVIILAMLFVGLLVAVSSLPFKNNYRLYSVMSGSMLPKIPVGSLAVVVPDSDYHVGDVITFISHGALSDKDTTTHRIVSVAKDGGQNLYTTKGDANEDPDAKPTLQNRVVGKYIGGITYLGYLLEYLVTLPGLIILIFAPALIIIIEEIKNIFVETKNIKQQRRVLALER